MQDLSQFIKEIESQQMPQVNAHRHTAVSCLVPYLLKYAFVIGHGRRMQITLVVYYDLYYHLGHNKMHAIILCMKVYGKIYTFTVNPFSSLSTQ